MNTLEAFTRYWTDSILLNFGIRSKSVVRFHKLAYFLGFAFGVAFCLRVTQKILTWLYNSLIKSIVLLLYRRILVPLAFSLAWIWPGCGNRCVWLLLIMLATGTEWNNSISLSQTLSSNFAGANRKWRHIDSFSFLDMTSVSKIFHLGVGGR